MNIIGARTWFFAIAALLAVLSIVFLIVFPLKPGIDFASGSLWTIKFDQPVEQSTLRQELNSLGYEGATIQPSASGEYIIHTLALSEAVKNQLKSDIAAKVGAFTEESYFSVPKDDAAASVKNAAIAVIISVIGMLLYIAFAFRKMPNPFRYGVCAVAGLAFDLIVALGIFAILGRFLEWEINLMFIAGILAVLGFSVNNTIIVFDRIRENTLRGIHPDIEVVANASIVQTLGRSFNSSLTALFTLFVLALFVGSSIQNFVTVLIIGVISGVYTSTCISPELLVTWQKRALKSNPGSGLATAKAKS
jgi:preprotein translocase subunit SecF